MKLSEQVKKAQETRRIAVDAMEALLAGIGEEGRTFNAEEQKAWDTNSASVKDLDAHLARLVDLEAATAVRTAPAGTENTTGAADDDGMPASAQRSLVIKTGNKRIKGGFFARYAHALYKAGGNQMLASQYAASEMKDKELAECIKAAQTPATTFTTNWAAELIRNEVMDFIELLRPLSVFADFPASTSFSFDNIGKITIPRMTTGIPGGWVKEGDPIPVGKGAFDSITLQPYKLGIITVATQEVLARSTPALEQILRDSMLRDTAIVLDRRMLSNAAGTSNTSPAGLFHSSKAATALTPSNTGVAVDDMLADIAALITAHAVAGSPMQNPVWIMHPTIYMKLMGARNAVGSFYFRDELGGKRLGGYPVIVTALMDVTGNGGGTSAINDIALVDGSQIVKGTGMSPQISMSDSATVHMESAPAADLGGASDPTPVRSLWQTQSVGLRLTYEADFSSRHTASVQWIDAVTW